MTSQNEKNDGRWRSEILKGPSAWTMVQALFGKPPKIVRFCFEDPPPGFPEKRKSKMRLKVCITRVGRDFPDTRGINRLRIEGVIRDPDPPIFFKGIYFPQTRGGQVISCEDWRRKED